MRANDRVKKGVVSSTPFSSRAMPCFHMVVPARVDVRPQIFSFADGFDQIVRIVHDDMGLFQRLHRLYEIFWILLQSVDRYQTAVFPFHIHDERVACRAPQRQLRRPAHVDRLDSMNRHADQKFRGISSTQRVTHLVDPAGNACVRDMVASNKSDLMRSRHDRNVQNEIHDRKTDPQKQKPVSTANNR